MGFLSIVLTPVAIRTAPDSSTGFELLSLTTRGSVLGMPFEENSNLLLAIGLHKYQDFLWLLRGTDMVLLLLPGDSFSVVSTAEFDVVLNEVCRA